MKIQENGNILLTLIELQSIAIHCENIGLRYCLNLSKQEGVKTESSEEYINEIVKKGTILEK